MEGKWPHITHQRSVTLTDSKGRKSNPTWTEITSALDGARPHAPWGILSLSCADTERVAGVKCSPGTVTPPSPLPALFPRPGKAAPCPGNTLGETKPMRRLLKYWLGCLLLPPKVYVWSNCAAHFSCSLLPSQSLSVLLSSTSCVVWQRWDSRGCCWHLEPSP